MKTAMDTKVLQLSAISLLFPGLGIEPRAPHILGKHSTTSPMSQAFLFLFCF
jgi:hypothetical protein